MGRQLVPHLDLVAVRVFEKDIGLARDKLASLGDFPARLLNGACSLVDVPRIRQAEAEVSDAAGLSDLVALADLENNDVLAAGRLRLDETPLTVNRQHAKHVMVKLKRPIEIADGECEVGEAEGFDHATFLVDECRENLQFIDCFALYTVATATPMTPERLNAFSDGVIAIIITIMVLELKVPHGSDFAALSAVLPAFLVYVLSLVVVGIYWNNHHHLLYLTDRVTGGVLWANLHLLFWLSLMPFVTGWMGENHFAPLPTALYGAVLLLAGIAYYILEQVIIRNQDVDSRLATAVGSDAKGMISIGLYASAIPLAFVNQWISDFIYALVAMVWLIPDRRIEALFDGSAETTG